MEDGTLLLMGEEEGRRREERGEIQIESIRSRSRFVQESSTGIGCWASRDGGPRLPGWLQFRCSQPQPLPAYGHADAYASPDLRVIRVDQTLTRVRWFPFSVWTCNCTPVPPASLPQPKPHPSSPIVAPRQLAQVDKARR